jgi:hypothetical protein
VKCDQPCHAVRTRPATITIRVTSRANPGPAGSLRMVAMPGREIRPMAWTRVAASVVMLACQSNADARHEPRSQSVRKVLEL